MASLFGTLLTLRSVGCERSVGGKATAHERCVGRFFGLLGLPKSPPESTFPNELYRTIGSNAAAPDICLKLGLVVLVQLVAYHLRNRDTPIKNTRDHAVGAFKGNDWNDRLNTAANAKRAAMEKFRSRPMADDPAAVEQRATRLAISVAREARLAERKAARAADEVKRAAENAAREAEEILRANERAAAELVFQAEQAAREIELQAQQAANSIALKAKQKAARDARYAARKARR